MKFGAWTLKLRDCDPPLSEVASLPPMDSEDDQIGTKSNVEFLAFITQ